MSKGHVRVKAETLRAFRRIRKMSQSQLAAAATEVLRQTDPDASLSESLVALIETNRRQPSLANAEAMAGALGIELEALADVTIEQVA